MMMICDRGVTQPVSQGRITYERDALEDVAN